ncbi:hypothetical protein LINGRAHAP2_LOCUS6440 [Linum grandiflorum]
MGKYSFLQIIIVALIFTATEANAQQKLCVDGLYPSGCKLKDCENKCWEKHQYRGAKCIANHSMTAYACVCVYPCST